MTYKVFITGAAGFIGFSLSNYLLSKGFDILGYDSLNDYYNVKLKKDRLQILKKYHNFKFIRGNLEDYKNLLSVTQIFSPRIIIHLAAQAGVQYSLENPKSYIDSNIIGTFNILELSKNIEIDHLLIASTSSIYGDNKKYPFNENDKSDSQLSIYAATKKATENLAYSYSHIWKIPITIIRLFTVYGPWGRPDMALFKFVDSILNSREIKIFNKGNMTRDFTYIDDVVKSIFLLQDVVPLQKEKSKAMTPINVVNIGNSKKVSLLNFIDAIEKALNISAKKNYLPMQIGDIKNTLSDNSKLKELINFVPNTDYKYGVKKFVEWYKKYYL